MTGQGHITRRGCAADTRTARSRLPSGAARGTMRHATRVAGGQPTSSGTVGRSTIRTSAASQCKHAVRRQARHRVIWQVTPQIRPPCPPRPVFSVCLTVLALCARATFARSAWTSARSFAAKIGTQHIFHATCFRFARFRFARFIFARFIFARAHLLRACLHPIRQHLITSCVPSVARSAARPIDQVVLLSRRTDTRLRLPRTPWCARVHMVQARRARVVAAPNTAQRSALRCSRLACCIRSPCRARVVSSRRCVQIAFLDQPWSGQEAR